MEAYLQVYWVENVNLQKKILKRTVAKKKISVVSKKNSNRSHSSFKVENRSQSHRPISEYLSG